MFHRIHNITIVCHKAIYISIFVEVSRLKQCSANSIGDGPAEEDDQHPRNKRSRNDDLNDNKNVANEMNNMSEGTTLPTQHFKNIFGVTIAKHFRQYRVVNIDESNAFCNMFENKESFVSNTSYYQIISMTKVDTYASKIIKNIRILVDNTIQTYFGTRSLQLYLDYAIDIIPLKVLRFHYTCHFHKYIAFETENH
jgi:hypothetical protein